MNALLRWQPPTHNVDGSPIKGAISYELYEFGAQNAIVTGIEDASYVINNPPAGTLCWYVKAVVAGMVSAGSNIVCEEIK